MFVAQLHPDLLRYRRLPPPSSPPTTTTRGSGNRAELSTLYHIRVGFVLLRNFSVTENESKQYNL